MDYKNTFIPTENLSGSPIFQSQSFFDCLFKRDVFMFINVDWSAPDPQNKIWCNVTSLGSGSTAHPNTTTYIFLWAFHYTSLPSVSVPVLSLGPSSVSRTAVISGITLGFQHRAFTPVYILPLLVSTEKMSSYQQGTRRLSQRAIGGVLVTWR